MQAIFTRLEESQKALTEELRYLSKQQLVSEIDARKIMNQAEATKNALAASIDRDDLEASTQSALLDALVNDYETSIEQLIYNIIRRKGQKSAISYVLHKTDQSLWVHLNKLRSEALISNEHQWMIKGFMDASRFYILENTPDKNNILSSPVNPQRITENYRRTILEYINNITQKKTSAAITRA